MGFGGIDATVKRSQTVLPTMQRPLGSSSLKGQYYRITSNLEEKFQRNGNRIRYERMIMKHFERYGLDTISYLKGPDGDMLSIITDHAKFTLEAAEKAEKDQMEFEYDSYDKANVLDAIEYVISSRVAIIRLGLDPELSKWCDDNDTIRIVTHAEANVAFTSDQDNPRVILLQAMLMEWLKAHGVDLDPQQATMDYSTWPGNENVGVQAHAGAQVNEAYIARKLLHLPETAKGTTKDSRSRRIIHTACLSDDEAEDDDIPSDLPNYKTHYLVENRDDKVAAFESIIHSHGNLELKYSTDANTNDYRSLPTKNHIACVLDRYKEIDAYLAKALNADNTDPAEDPESGTSPSSSKRQKTTGDDVDEDSADPTFNPQGGNESDDDDELAST